MTDKQPRTSGRGTSTRLLWVLGLMAGILIGVVAAFGLASAQAAQRTAIAGLDPPVALERDDTR